MAPRENRSFHLRVEALTAILLILGPLTVWAHEETPHEWPTTTLDSLWPFLFVTALLAIWITGRPHFQSHLQPLHRRMGRPVPWAVIGLLGVHLIALPPHLVHHLANPPDDGLRCALFVQGNASDQERAEPVPPVVSLSLPGAMADCPAAPALVFPIPTRSGRSPPGR
jgi:hypothetical protein